MTTEERPKIRSVSTSLRQDEVEVLRKIAKNRHTSLAGVTRAAIRFALQQGFGGHRLM